MNSDNFNWASPFGGSWGAAANWQDTTTGTVAGTPPSTANAVTIAGGSGGNFTNIVGSGAAAQVSISGDVLLWGTVAVSGGVSLIAGSEFDLDGGASVNAAGLALGAGAGMQAADSSVVKATGTATLTDGTLLAASGSSVQLGSLIANADGLNNGMVAVDDGASIEIGLTGNVALGAVTIDNGQSATMTGTLDGNLVVNGALSVQAGGVLAIDMADPFGTARTITGSGTLLIGEGSRVMLGVADSAAIQFAAPDGTLVASVLPNGTISGFASGDAIELTGLATGLSYTQTSATLATLTLSKGGITVGKLTLSGNYAGKLFHIQLNAAGTAVITLQTIGAAPVQPTAIAGTAGSDLLVATANNQTLTGWGGSDVLSGATFTGIDFKDTSADLNGSTIAAFGVSDTIDLTDMKPGSAVVTFTPATYSASAPPVPAMLVVNDGTHAATVTLTATGSMPPGVWSASADGSGGSALRYATINTDAYTFNPVFGDSIGVTANWKDTTTGATATALPGVGNAISLTGGSNYTDIGGNGVAASVTTSGDVLMLGTITVGSAIAGISGAMAQQGTLALDKGANLHLTGTATIGGMLVIGGASTLTASSLSGGEIVSAAGSTVQFASVAAGSTLVLATDATSSIEFGSNGTARAGAVSIDSGVTASLGGTISGNVVVNGTLLASGRSLSIVPFGQGTASVTGLGTLEIDGGGTLGLGGADSAAILFSPSGGTLTLGGGLPSGTVSGFGKGDAIRVGRPVTSIAYSPASATLGTLTFFNAGTSVGSMLFAGSYTAQQFQLLVSPNGLSGTIVYVPVPSTAPGSQISSGSDAYGWTNSGGGIWSNAGNWTDITTGTPATGGPGAGDSVVIQDNPGPSTQQIIAGSGAAASLQVYGPANTVFTGTLAVSGEFYAAATAGSDVALASGAQIWAASVYDYTGMTISGGSTLTATGAAGGITEVVGGMSVVGSSSVKANGGLDIGGGTLGVDATSVFEAGSLGGAATGAFTIDAGQTATIEENGTIAAGMVVNGLLIADNATIEGFGGTAGSIGGSGTIAIGSPAGPGRLTLRSPDSATLLFNQPGDVLELQGALPTGAISGFSGSDTIQLDQTVTGVSFTQTNSLQGTLKLTDGAATVGTLTLLGNYAGSRFQIDVAAPTGFGTISVLPTTSSGISSTASLAVSHYTPLTGQIAISGMLAISAGVLALSGGAKLTAQNATIGGGLEAGGGSSATITYTATLSGGVLQALNGSTIQAGALLGFGSGNIVAVDSSSIIKIGSPSAVAGALTQAAGCTVAMNGSIYGNVVTNGTLGVAGGGTLFIDMTGTSASDPYETTSSIGGSGTLAIAEGATLGLGAIDTAAIQFTGPNATLALAAIPSGTISGFYASDQIVLDQTVTGISYTQLTPTAAALTLNNGGTMVGTLNLAGNFSGNLFHLDPAADGASATITLQTLGLAAAQPTLIQGAMVTEALTATANGQTLTGGGGNDTLNGAGFTSLDFKDTTAHTNFYTIQNFVPSDFLDLIDMNTNAAWVRYANGIVSVSDGVHSANLSLTFATTPASGSFHVSSDGASGAKLTWG
ncbi:MAG TPA: hypothetical protein DDZ81_13890 [Acetobacteraceae bacterium]|nr:hypothetical protein [Acetobacteraceae bacterium]